MGSTFLDFSSAAQILVEVKGFFFFKCAVEKKKRNQSRLELTSKLHILLFRVFLFLFLLLFKNHVYAFPSILRGEKTTTYHITTPILDLQQ